MIPRRLDKFLADATHLSRRDINRALDQGRVEVRAPREAGHGDLEPWRLIFEGDTVIFDGHPIEISPARHYFAFHKPGGVLSTTRDPHGRCTLEPWLEKLPDVVFPVGRLDRATTGFLLLIDDGDLCYCLLRPWFGVQKEYHLTLRGRVEPGDARLDALLAGIDIGDNKSPAVALSVEVLEHQPLKGEEARRKRVDWQTLVSVVVDEGRNRMVRRMARGAGFKLDHLHRPRIASVELGEVEPGEYRRLSEAEVEELWAACGGRQAAESRNIAALKRHAETWRAEGRPHLRLERWLASISDETSVDGDNQGAGI